MVVGVFSVCWLPVAIVAELKYSSVDVYNDIWYQAAYRACKFLILVNSAANPFIYALRMKSFRTPMLRILQCQYQGQSQLDGSEANGELP